MVDAHGGHDVNAEPLLDEELRDHRDLEGNHQGDHEDDEQGSPPQESDTGEGVAGQGAEH